MAEYYAYVEYRYSETLDVHNHRYLLDPETESNLPTFRYFPLLLHGVNDTEWSMAEDQCKSIIDCAVTKVFQTFSEMGIIAEEDCRELIRDNPNDCNFDDPENPSGRYWITFPIRYPMPEKMFSDCKRWGVIDKDLNTKPYMKHLYTVRVDYDAESEMLDRAVSNFELWKDRTIHKSGLYPSHKDQVTIDGLCECLLHELINAWKSWALERHVKHCMDNGLPLFEKTSDPPTLASASPETTPAESTEEVKQFFDDIDTTKTGGDVVEDLEALRQSYPCVPKGSQDKDDWIHVKTFAEMIGKKTRSLINDRGERSGGRKTKDGCFGVDKNGYVWGKASENGQCFYRNP